MYGVIYSRAGEKKFFSDETGSNSVPRDASDHEESNEYLCSISERVFTKETASVISSNIFSLFFSGLTAIHVRTVSPRKRDILRFFFGQKS